MPDSSTSAPTPGEPYWASREKHELLPDLTSRICGYGDGMEERGLYDRMRSAYRRYYGIRANGSWGAPAARTGARGEVVDISAGHFRNLIAHMMTFVTGQRPAIQVRPVNMDSQSLAQAQVAQGILEYYWREKRLERRYRQAVEIALICGRGYIHQVWDFDRGDAYDIHPETGEAVPEGDVAVDVLTPFDVVKSFNREFDDLDWVIVRLRRNRHDLAARFPEYAEQILAAQADSRAERHDLNPNDAAEKRLADRDVVYEYRFYHRPSPALPTGRQLRFVGTEACLSDGPLPYDRIPVFSVAASSILGTSDGYTSTWDLLALQEAHDMVLSAVVSNMDAFGHQRIVMDENCDVSPAELSGGATIIRVPPGTTLPPTAVNLCAMPDSWAPLEEKLVQSMEIVSGINSVARGAPPPSVKSGSGMALLHTQTAEFLGPLQESNAHLIEDGMSGLVSILRAFAQTPRMALIAGSDKRPLLTQWSGANLDRINRVTVDVGSAVSQTAAGRFEQATHLKDLQTTLGASGGDVQRSFSQLVQVATTGKLEPVTEGVDQEHILIRDENQRLMAGTPVTKTLDPIMGTPVDDTPEVPVYPTDDDVAHIRSHAAQLNSVEVRTDPERARVYLAHISGHVRSLRAKDPVLSTALGLPALAMPVGPADPAAAPGGGGSPAGPPKSEKGPGGTEMPGQPKLPKDPRTGTRVDPGGAPPVPRGDAAA